MVALALGLSVTFVLAATASALLFGIHNGVSHPNTLVRVDEVFRSAGGALVRTDLLSKAQVRVLADATPVIARAATYHCGLSTIHIGVQSTDIRVCEVSANYFMTVGTPPALLGRLFDTTAVAGHSEIVLSAECWRRLFESDTSIVGRTVVISGASLTVSAIAPVAFRGVDAELADAWTTSAAWRTAGTGPASASDGNPNFRSVTALLRIGPHFTRSTANAAVNAYYGSHARLEGISSTGRLELRPTSLSDRTSDSIPGRIGVWTLVLLAISTASVFLGALDLGILLGIRRLPELRIRWVLGADPSRLQRLDGMHCLYLTGSAALGALLLTNLIWRWLARGWLGREALFDNLATPPFMVFGAIATVTVFIALLLPRLVLSPTVSVRLGKLGHHTMTPSHALARSILLGVAVCVFVVITAASGGLARQIRAAQRVRLGLDIDRLIVGTLERPLGYRSAAVRDNALEGLRAVAARTPGVMAVSMANGLPFVATAAVSVRKPDGGYVETSSGSVPYLLSVTPSYFQTTGTRFIAGRTFDRDDSVRGTSVIVSATFAKAAWPQQSAVGSCLYLGADSTCQPVIGVVEDAKRRAVVGEMPGLQVYLPLRPAEDESPIRVLVARASADPSITRNVLRRAFARAGADAAALRWRTLAEVVEPQWQPLFVALTLLSYATVGLACSTGAALYGVYGEVVARRRHEFAIRLSIGAPPWRVVMLLLRSTGVPVVMGIVGGLCLLVFAEPLVNLPVRGLPTSYSASILAGCSGVVVVLIIALVAPILRILAIDPARELPT